MPTERCTLVEFFNRGVELRCDTWLVYWDSWNKHEFRLDSDSNLLERWALVEGEFQGVEAASWEWSGSPKLFDLRGNTVRQLQAYWKEKSKPADLEVPLSVVTEVLREESQDAAEWLANIVKAYEGSFRNFDAVLHYRWQCGVEGRWWEAELRGRQFGKYLLTWIYCDEVGESDWELVDLSEFSGCDELKEELRHLASEKGDGPSGCGNIEFGDWYCRPGILRFWD
ncbi:MAG: hypothetical protein QXS68_07960 [Candidatus Methanomethylicaceae archaeon]